MIISVQRFFEIFLGWMTRLGLKVHALDAFHDRKEDISAPNEKCSFSKAADSCRVKLKVLFCCPISALKLNGLD